MAVYVILSPHLDDAVFSCGGWMAQRASAGEEVRVLTICAGDPPPGPLSPFAERLHTRWRPGVAPASVRRAEDLIATGRLGALARHFDVPDAIYRKTPEGVPLYPDEAAIFGRLHPEDAELVERLGRLLSQACDSTCQVLCPLAIGGHVDHVLTRQAAERMALGLWYYRDMPYDSRGGTLPEGCAIPEGGERIVPLAPEEIEAWASAVAEYRSQLSTFWTETAQLLKELSEYHDRWGGVRLTVGMGAGSDVAGELAGGTVM